jgi:hypothetical protein
MTTNDIEKLGEEIKAIKHKNCAGLIKDSLASLNDELKEMMSNANHDDYFDDPALSIDEFTLTSICLSYGGPSSYLEVKHQGSDIISVTYRFSDWFDTATLPVYESEPAYEYARGVIESRYYE